MRDGAEVARQPHELKVVGSNPTPAPNNQLVYILFYLGGSEVKPFQRRRWTAEVVGVTVSVTLFIIAGRIGIQAGLISQPPWVQLSPLQP